jgi:hypothetical protein
VRSARAFSGRHEHLTFMGPPSARVCVNPRRSASKSIQVTTHCSVKRHPARVGCVGFPPFYSSLHTWRLEPPGAQSTSCLLVPFSKRKEADAADARGRRACGRRISELSMRSTRTDARRRESKKPHSIQTSDSAKGFDSPTCRAGCNGVVAIRKSKEWGSGMRTTAAE